MTGGAGFDLSTPVDLGGAATTSASLNLHSDLDLYVLSFGIKGDYQLGALSINLVAGPTVNIADFETSITQNVVFNTDGTIAYASNSSDNSQDIILGLFVAIGAEYSISEKVSLALDYRYDDVLEYLETDHAEMNLDGQSIQAKVTFKF